MEIRMKLELEYAKIVEDVNRAGRIAKSYEDDAENETAYKVWETRYQKRVAKMVGFEQACKCMGYRIKRNYKYYGEFEPITSFEFIHEN